MANGTGMTRTRCRSRLAVLAATAGLAPAVAMSAGQAQAAPHPAAARGQVAAGVISTIAGGVGGPAKGSRLALFGPCGVAFSAGSAAGRAGWKAAARPPGPGCSGRREWRQGPRAAS